MGSLQSELRKIAEKMPVVKAGLDLYYAELQRQREEERRDRKRGSRQSKDRRPSPRG